ncbi:MAG: HAD-IIIC family phosphatase, partial [Candidatus Aminicenantes bacterium]|nr:HAD-IIIC family phosphatase [Candidatus Aminicenantes bacterium]
ENYILWWGEQFGLHMDIEFAPYNQVFPQLLDEESLLSTNTGINLLLIRFEDWIRDLDLPDEDACNKLEDDFIKLVKIIKEKSKPAPYFVGLFPAAGHLSLNLQVRYYIKGITRRWRKIIEEIDNVYPVDFTPLKELYNIDEIFDSLTDREGHVPFSTEFYAVMGTTIFRNICALDQHPFKVVILDCDNTLWQGICGEEDPEGVSVAPPYLELQQRMIRLHDKGFLLTLCSKNNEADVWEVFEKNPGMVLKKEHLAGWIINWQPKSENIKELAKELNLGMDSFIFLDDSPVECAEVRSNCPEVLTLQLPENPENIPLFLKHVWAFDKVKITGEDRQRTKMYQAEKKRKEAADSADAAGMLHANYLLPLRYFTAGLLLELPAYKFDEKTRSRAEYEAPRDEVESKLVEIWKKILGVERIGVNDSFFDSGGNFLKVITLLSGIHKAFDVKLTFRDIFDNKTIRQISNLTARVRKNVYSAIEVAKEKDFYLMSSAQERLFVLQQLEPASTAYNLTTALELSGNTDKERLLDTSKKLIARHDSFRTSFVIIDEEPVQRIHSAADIEFEIEYYEARSKQEEIDIIDRFIRPFDLAQAPLLRVGLIKIETRKHILAISMHHIISDGTSSIIFSR